MKAGWTEVSLGEICEFRYGKALKANERSGAGWPVYGSNGPVGAHETALTEGPTIVVGRKGSYGQVHYSDGPVWPIDTTYFVEATCTPCDLKWLSYRLAGLRLNELNRAAAVPGLNREDAYRRRLLLPPLDEQRRIARILDAAEELRVKRIAAGRKLRELYRGALDRWLLASSSCHLETSVGEVADLVTKGTTPTSVGLSYAEDGVPFIRVTDLDDGVVAVSSETLSISQATDQELARSRIHAGDVLISIAGTIGRVALVPDDAPDMNCNQAVAIVRPGATVRPRFFRAVLESDSVASQMKQSTVTGTIANLSLAQVRALRIRVPPLAEQTQFEVIDGVHRASLRRDTAHLAVLNTLFSSLQQGAFSGTL